MSIPFVFANQTGIIPLNELDANFTYLDTKVPVLALTAGTVTQAAQPAITSVGTLGSLSVTGPISSASISASQIFGTLQTPSQPNINQIGTLSALTVSNTITTGSLTATTVTGQITTAAQPSITSLGTLTDVTVSGNITGTLATAAQPNITSLGALSTLTVSGGITGTLSTPVQPNITGLGTLTALSVSGNVTAAGVTASSVSATSIVGSVTTAAQPNITSLGTLTALSVSGGLSVGGTASLSGLVTAPTAANGTSNTQVATTAFVSNTVSSAALPSGVIMLWSGSVFAIPTGFLLCDGTNGTPDLRDRFIVGAGGVYGPGTTGGSADAIVVSHTHTATSSVSDPGHAHSYLAPQGTSSGGAFGSVVDNAVGSTTGSAGTGISVTTTVNSTGGSGTNANLPPYFALAYIMKA
jgi:hypothetical protein